MRISDWSSDVCSSDLRPEAFATIDPAGSDHEEGIERRRRNHVERRRLERRCARAHDDENAGEADDHRPPAPPTHVLAQQRHRERGNEHGRRSEEHTSELQSLMRSSYAVFCLKKKTHTSTTKN